MVLLIVIIVLIYFLPTVIAMARGVPHLGSIFVINLFLGWNLIGWVVALAMATRSVTKHWQNPYQYH